jgi:hypothetical protein
LIVGHEEISLSRNGSGTYNLPAGNPVAGGTVIQSTWANSTLSDIGNEITNSIPRDGQAGPTASIPMGGFKLTNLGAGTLATDSTQLAQVQNGAVAQLTSVAGTNAITAITAPSFAAYVDGQLFHLIPANTTTATGVTLAVNGLAAIPIATAQTTTLIVGELVAGVAYLLRYVGSTANFYIVGGGTFQTSLRIAGITALLAPLASPALTGTPTAPTAAGGTNTTQIATTAFVANAYGTRKPTRQVFTSGTGTYTTPANVTEIRVRMIGGGGGGGGNSTDGSSTAGGNGGASTFGTSSAGGGHGGGAGQGGSQGTGGTGGTNANADFSIAGGTGGVAANVGGAVGPGGSGAFGGAGQTNGAAGAANSGAGGAGAVVQASADGGGGGGSGGYLEVTFASPAATYSYAVGAGGASGSAGTGGGGGGAGGSGIIIVDEFYT